MQRCGDRLTPTVEESARIFAAFFRFSRSFYNFAQTKAKINKITKIWEEHSNIAKREK